MPATQYIVDWVTEQLPQLVKSYDQSIIVETTINPELQARAEKALRKRLNEEGAKLEASQGALVMMDTSGAIKAMVGGKSYKSQFNRVTKAKRQPGSAFKPFVYLAAIEQGYTPNRSRSTSRSRSATGSRKTTGANIWAPVTLKKALALSLNTVAAKLVCKVGPENAWPWRTASASPRSSAPTPRSRLAPRK